MSWWDTKGLTSLATHALKSAQKKIDKVLDIKEDEESAEYIAEDAGLILPSSSSSSSLTSPSKNAAVFKKSAADDESFFSGWLSPSSTTREKTYADESSVSAVMKKTRSTLDRRSLENHDSAEVVPSQSTSSLSPERQRSRHVSSDSDNNLKVGTTITIPNESQFAPKSIDQSTVTVSHKINDHVHVVDSSVNADNNLANLEKKEVNTLVSLDVVQNANLETVSPRQLSSKSVEHSDVSLLDASAESFQVDGASCERSIAGWSDACDSRLWEASIIGTLESSSTAQTIDSMVFDDLAHTPVIGGKSAEELCQSYDTQPLREVSSLEGSLETSADELSEGNKTLIGEDSDANHNDTDVDDARLDSLNTSGMHGDEISLGHNEITLDNDAVNLKLKELDTEVELQQVVNMRDLVSPGQNDVGDKSTESISPHSSVSTGSYVKNLLEEAMVDTIRDGAGSSEQVRNESGGNSGHTSADEIDTTTSSDIEVISHTSASGSAATGLVCRQFDISPSRQHSTGSGWVGRAGSSAAEASLHRRSDSGSSAQSLQSRTEDDFASPDGYSSHTGGEHQYRLGRETTRRHSNKCEPDYQQNNPYDLDKLLKKLAEMAEILDVREKKQLDLSHENMDLVESNNDLRNRVLQLEHSRETELIESRSIREDCARKVADLEKKLQLVTREKDSLKVNLHEAEIEIARRSENIVSEKLLKEKDQTITELMEEGEKLSKKQLQQSNMIKKLRVKEKENETLISSQKLKVDEQKAEIERLESILDAKVETEKKHIDAINQLNAVVKAQEDEINRLKSDLEDAQEKYRTVKTALDNSYKEISELHKARVTHVSEAHKAAIDVEIAAKEQLSAALDEYRQQSKREQMALVNQIEDLQLSLSRMEKEHGRREDILRQEVSDLQQRLQEAEERNHELTQSVSGVTRPLLRQIENLQSTYAAQTASYERVEKSLTDRLVEAQNQLVAAVEKERFASEKLMESSMRLSSLESQTSSLRQERSRLLAELDIERAKVDLAEEAKHNETAQKDATQHKLETELTELKKEKVLLENQLEMEKMKVETGKKKVALLHDQIREKDMLLQMTSSVSPSPTPTTLSREDSFKVDSQLSVSSAPADFNERMFLITSPAVGSRASLYDSLRQSGSASSLIESLQSELKQREGEISQLQSEITELERTRESMARELVNLTIRNEDLSESMKELDEYKLQYRDLDSRYNALLQMYGEKVEETQELRLDLQDVKDMYRTQIDELLMSKSATKLSM